MIIAERANSLRSQKFVQIGVIRGLESAWMEVIAATPKDP
jgi:hypothetical protein